MTVNQSPQYSDTEIVINCPLLTPELQAIIDRIRLLDCSVKGRLDGEPLIVSRHYLKSFKEAFGLRRS